jgi:hypothetical protein
VVVGISPAGRGRYVLCLPDVWDKVSILYLALVSIYALVITAAGGEQAAEASQKADKNQETSS